MGVEKGRLGQECPSSVRSRIAGLNSDPVRVRPWTVDREPMRYLLRMHDSVCQSINQSEPDFRHPSANYNMDDGHAKHNATHRYQRIVYRMRRNTAGSLDR